ncbi:hypothetical protein JB92DRAFT_3120388 [Gautieria morchelliformis]|nr:hypothetical protein JB92DRAFT_3120388 [Gautieria morchelliformis]
MSDAQDAQEPTVEELDVEIKQEEQEAEEKRNQLREKHRLYQEHKEVAEKKKLDEEQKAKEAEEKERKAWEAEEKEAEGAKRTLLKWYIDDMLKEFRDRQAWVNQDTRIPLPEPMVLDSATAQARILMSEQAIKQRLAKTKPRSTGVKKRKVVEEESEEEEDEPHNNCFRQKARTEPRPRQPLLETAHSPSVEALPKYEMKEEKDAREAEAREWGMKGKGKGKGKGKAKDKGSVHHQSLQRVSLVLRLLHWVTDERVEELVERSEDLMRNVSVELNELNGSVLELEGVQAMIRRLLMK